MTNNMNRRANCKNPFQGKRKKVLCVCSAGLLRSPTAAVVLAKEFGYNTRAAGLSNEYALIPVDDVLLEWADEVICFEFWQWSEIASRLDKLGLKTSVYNLGIEDGYGYMAPELIDEITKAYAIVG